MAPNSLAIMRGSPLANPEGAILTPVVARLQHVLPDEKEHTHTSTRSCEALRLGTILSGERFQCPAGSQVIKVRFCNVARR